MTRIKLPREKKVGHLTLHRQPRTISSREFNALSRAERLAVLQSVSGRRKYDLLIEAVDAEQLLRRLPPQEVYLLARELGADDIPELVAMASPEQVTALIDLDCWSADQLDRPAGLHWLSLLLEADDEHVHATLKAMDAELLVAILQYWVVVVSGPEDLDNDDARAEANPRNGGYSIEFTDSEAAKPIGRLLDILLNLDPELFRRLVEGMRQELPTQLEEELYRWRNGRLQDFGFADPHEAKSIYAWLDPQQFRIENHLRETALLVPRALQPPGYLLTDITPRPLLAEVLSRGLDSERAWELTFLLNKLMAADQVDPGDSAQVSGALDRLYGTLNLALEWLAGQDVEAAAGVFDQVYYEFLFRLGSSLSQQLARRARKIMASAIGPYIDLPLRQAVEALVRKRPEFYRPLGGSNHQTTRHFSSLQDLELVACLLERLEQQERLITRHFPVLLPDPQLDLAGCKPDQVADLVLSELFLTALANRLLERDFVPRPLVPAELPRLHRQVSLAGALDPQLRERTCQWLEGLEPGGGSFAEWCLGVWEEEFCPLRPEELNPRFLAGLIIRLQDE